MSKDSFPPVDENKKGFYPRSVYREVVERYPTVADLVSRKAEENGDKVWLECTDGRRFTYQKVDALSGNLASGLYRAGVRPDHHVAIFALNSPEWLIAYFAILKLGAVPVTVNTGFIKDPLIYNLTASKTEFLFIDVRLMDRFNEIEDALPAIGQLFVIGKNSFDRSKAPDKPCLFIEDLFDTPADPAHLCQRYPNDPCAMILTSGTTGPSKVVADANAQFITTALFLADAGGLDPNSVMYTYLPLFHIMALDMAAVLTLLANAKIVLTETFNPAVFWEHVKAYGVTHFPAVGPILEMLFKSPPSPLEKDHGPITAVAYCSKEIWNMARERFDITITGGYGSTEVGIPVGGCYDVVKKGENPPGACGQVGPHVDVKIMDERGQILAPGQTGEIVIRPAIPWAIFLEYFDMPGATAEAFRGLWFHTGDAGYFDEDGYLYFVDRLKDAIRRKGENISSYEVEQILLKNPSVAEAIVIPAPSEVGEDEVMAVVVASPEKPVAAEEIIAYCKENMPHFWTPRYIRFVDTLPRTHTGKIEKFKMRKEGVTKDTHDRKKKD